MSSREITNRKSILPLHPSGCVGPKSGGVPASGNVAPLELQLVELQLVELQLVELQPVELASVELELELELVSAYPVGPLERPDGPGSERHAARASRTRARTRTPENLRARRDLVEPQSLGHAQALISEHSIPDGQSPTVSQEIWQSAPKAHRTVLPSTEGQSLSASQKG